MKLKDILIELTHDQQVYADAKIGFTSGHDDDEADTSKKPEVRKTPTGPKKYYIRGKDKKNADKRWGPFDSSSDAAEFKRTRTDIRGAKTVFE